MRGVVYTSYTTLDYGFGMIKKTFLDVLLNSYSKYRICFSGVSDIVINDHL